MAINFIKDISETNLLFSHNNNIIQYYTDINLPILRSDITINGIVKQIYPSPVLGFYFNLKNIVSTLINTTNYTDDLQTDLSTSYTYDWQKGFYLNTDIEIKIVFENGSSDSITRDLHFILHSVNLVEYNKRFPLTVGLGNTILFQPLINGANNKSYFKYWQGYPFDIGIYKGLDSVEITAITNLTNGLGHDFPLAGVKGFERIVFSDGNANTTIENVLPFVVGFNELEFDTGINTYFATVEVEKGCPDGVYMKWLNSSGGYSYWLFKNTGIQRNYDNIGFLNNDFENLEDTTSPQVSLGVNSNDNYIVYDEILREEQKDLISTMLDSPKVYLFTGTPFSQNNFNDWVEVKLSQGEFIIKNIRRDLYNIDVAFSLPNNYNITV